jgi:hypothetical protein
MACTPGPDIHEQSLHPERAYMHKAGSLILAACIIAI